MDMKTLMSRYLDYCEFQKRLDAKTRKAYRIDLTQLSEKLGERDVAGVTSGMLELVVVDWHKKYKPKTVKRKIASVKAFFHWMEEMEYVEENPFRKIHTKFREPKTLPKTIPEHNLKRFLQAIYDERKEAATANQRRNALRDAAVIEVLFGTGIRISELCGLKVEDANLVEGEILIHGKGRKERMMQMPDDCLRRLLCEYYSNYQKEIEACGYLFVNNRQKPLSDASVRKMIQKYADKAKISQHITPHMFRHTFATSLLDSDVNLRCIQEMLGHSSVQTTEIYTHVSAAKQRQILMEHHPRKGLNVQA